MKGLNTAIDFEHSFEPLTGGISVCVSARHRFGTDAFLLADFTAPRRTDIVCDLGTGCGIIPLLWNRDANAAPGHVTAVDIMPQAVEQLAISVRRYALSERITPLEGDLREIRGLLPGGRFDVVSCNPPYMAAGRGLRSQTREDLAARHETACTLEDVCAAGAYLLRFGGRICICQRPQRLAGIICAMRAVGLEPKRLRFVHQRTGSEPWLALVEARKGSGEHMRVMPPLYIEDENGGFSQELMKIYNNA